MELTKQEMRLKHIKTKYQLFFFCKCNNCKNYFIREKMWYVLRYRFNMNVVDYFYCTKCFPTKEDVLSVIDSDAGGGIAFVDDYYRDFKPIPLPPRKPKF